MSLVILDRDGVINQDSDDFIKSPDELHVIPGSLDVLTENYMRTSVNSAGQLPSGFDPKDLYASRNHPRGLQLTVYGASDAVQ